MEPEKIAKFYSILLGYKGQIGKRTSENDVYREKKVYNLWTELAEKFDSFWQSIGNLFYIFFRPVNTLTLTFERLVSRVAFCPPRDTYAFNFDWDKSSDSLGEDVGELLLSQYATTIRQNVIKSYRTKTVHSVRQAQCFYATSKYGNRIACMFIQGPAQSTFDSSKVIFYSHTNAEDIGTSFLYMWRLRKSLEMPVFMYEYSGYGMSSGSPSERNLYADAEAALEELCRRTGFKVKDIIVFGESIGSVPTVYLASRLPVAGVILQSAFLSGLRIYFDYNGPTLLFDPFPNVERLHLIQAKTLLIHGSQDQLVDISHAQRMHQVLKNSVTPFWANGQSHMNIYKHTRYYDRLKYFVHIELNN